MEIEKNCVAIFKYENPVYKKHESIIKKGANLPDLEID